MNKKKKQDTIHLTQEEYNSIEQSFQDMLDGIKSINRTIKDLPTPTNEHVITNPYTHYIVIHKMLDGIREGNQELIDALEEKGLK